MKQATPIQSPCTENRFQTRGSRFLRHWYVVALFGRQFCEIALTFKRYRTRELSVTDQNKYVLMTAAHDEEANIANTIESVVSQSIPPVKWVIVSDNSTYRTDSKLYERMGGVIAGSSYFVESDPQVTALRRRLLPWICGSNLARGSGSLYRQYRC